MRKKIIVFAFAVFLMSCAANFTVFAEDSILVEEEKQADHGAVYDEIQEPQDHSIAPIANINTVKKWDFSDNEYANLGVLTEDITINELTMHKNIGFVLNSKDINNTSYTRYMAIRQSSTPDKSYITISLNGPSNVYFIAQTNAKNNPRNLIIHSNDTDETQYLTVNEGKGYCYKYRGNGGTIEVRSEIDTIRVYAIMIEEYNESKYNYLNNQPIRVWDPKEINLEGRLSENMDFNGLQIFKGVDFVSNSITNNYKFHYDKAIDLENEGTSEKNAIALDVLKNTDIYIAARSTNDSVIRPLRITDIGGCDLENVENIQYFNVDGSINTYKFTYTGDATTLYIYSDNGGIRIYQVAAVKQSNKKVDGVNCNFSAIDDISIGQKIDEKNIGELSILNAYVVASTSSDYSKAIKLNTDRFENTEKLRLNITDCVQSKKTKTLCVTAKGPHSKIALANQYGYVIDVKDMTEDIADYNFAYSGPYDTLYIYLISGSAEVYSIKTLDDAEAKSITINTKAGSRYRYVFTVENAPTSSGYKYIIEYDPSKLKIKHIGKDNNFDGGLTDNSIENVVQTEGKVTFNIAGSDVYNWSGIATSVVFDGIADGSAIIKFSAERRN